MQNNIEREGREGGRGGRLKETGGLLTFFLENDGLLEWGSYLREGA